MARILTCTEAISCVNIHLSVEVLLSPFPKGLLLFDLDGTLVNSAPDLAVAVNKALTDLGLECFAESVVGGWVGNGVKVLIERALSGSSETDTGLEPAQVDRALALFLSITPIFLQLKQRICKASA